MKKIMFNDRFGLTDAVLDGRKTVTRRVIPDNKITGQILNNGEITLYKGYDGTVIKPSYQVGEIVAVAQAYNDCGKFDIYEAPKDTAGWNNKMFVKASLMPHQIEILDVRLERLQDITDEDCIKEGVEEYPFGWVYFDSNVKLSGGMQSFSSPREAFASLIDKVGKKGTWKSNPYVFRIEFKRVK